jgi:hypothetical protein
VEARAMETFQLQKGMLVITLKEIILKINNKIIM